MTDIHTRLDVFAATYALTPPYLPEGFEEDVTEREPEHFVSSTWRWNPDETAYGSRDDLRFDWTVRWVLSLGDRGDKPMITYGVVAFGLNFLAHLEFMGEGFTAQWERLNSGIARLLEAAEDADIPEHLALEVVWEPGFASSWDWIERHEGGHVKGTLVGTSTELDPDGRVFDQALRALRDSGRG